MPPHTPPGPCAPREAASCHRRVRQPRSRSLPGQGREAAGAAAAVRPAELPLARATKPSSSASPRGAAHAAAGASRKRCMASAQTASTGRTRTHLSLRNRRPRTAPFASPSFGSLGRKTLPGDTGRRKEVEYKDDALEPGVHEALHPLAPALGQSAGWAGAPSVGCSGLVSWTGPGAQMLEGAAPPNAPGPGEHPDSRDTS
ncbi:hypothetical protein AAY473_010237 [Plecturocebus cupreus]